MKIIERLKELRAKATPGPYFVDNLEGPSCIYSAAIPEGRTVCVTPRIAQVEPTAVRGQREATAALIAAAINALPALLEAAEAAENMATVWYSGEEKTGFNARDCMIRQRAAIEKLREVNTK